jgi:hypothetical protein
MSSQKIYYQMSSQKIYYQMSSQKIYYEYYEQNYRYTHKTKVFKDLCVSGQIKAAKLFYIEHRSAIEIQHIYSIFFTIALTKNVHIIEWLYKQHIPFNSIKINYLFSEVCTKGHKSMIQWFLTTFPETINQIEQEFEQACLNNQIFIAKLLFQLKPSVVQSLSNNDHFIWKKAVFNCYYDIIDFIQQTKPEVYVYIRRKNLSNLHYIRSEKEIRLQKQLIPLWLTCSNSPNKNSIWYQLPRDISRYIIQQFI